MGRHTPWGALAVQGYQKRFVSFVVDAAAVAVDRPTIAYFFNLKSDSTDDVSEFSGAGCHPTCYFQPI